MKKRKNKLWLPIILFGSFFVISGVYVVNRNNKLDKNGIYSICTIRDIYRTRGGLRVKLFFLYKGDTIQKDYVDASGTIKYNMVGKRYFIKFLPGHSSGVFEYSINNPVPDDIKEAPYNGWEKPPVPLIDNYGNPL